jgi:energy-coupling factor transporter ATP-binding protein EcfA2
MVRLVGGTVTTAARGDAPAPPVRLADTGLSDRFLIDLLVRHLSRAGESRAAELGRRVALPLSVLEPTLDFLRAEKLIEVPRRGTFDGDVSYALTSAGASVAQASFAKCQYCGPAPVTLEDYVARVEAQGARHCPVNESMVRSALEPAVVSRDLVHKLGAAVNSGKALYMYGPSGSGKTYLAERLVKVMSGAIWVPHAIVVDGEVIQVFDPIVHRPIDDGLQSDGIDRQSRWDRRWIRTQRPVVMTGGELTLEMLELEFEQVSRFYIAPPQVKANNGMMVIDDLGRQRVAARDLMNRWIVPLDRGVDYMSLHTGTKFKVPFDVGVIFSSNLAPMELGDAAFARRLGYKLRIGAMDESDYRRVFVQACERAELEPSRAAADFLVRDLHGASRMPLYPTIPYDVVSKLRDRARFLGVEPELSDDGLRWAWELYFAPDDGDPTGVLSLDTSR